MTSNRVPLFVRLSEPVATELDARIEVDRRTKQSVVEDMLARQLGTTTESGNDIMDLKEVARMLRVGEEEILERIGAGDFPARRLGDSWRFSRVAVTAWLHGTDATTDRPTGFVSG